MTEKAMPKVLVFSLFRGNGGRVSLSGFRRGFVLLGKAERTFGTAMGFSSFQFIGLREFREQMFPCNAGERFERSGIMPGSVYV